MSESFSEGSSLFPAMALSMKPYRSPRAVATVKFSLGLAGCVTTESPVGTRTTSVDTLRLREVYEIYQDGKAKGEAEGVDWSGVYANVDGQFWTEEALRKELTLSGVEVGRAEDPCPTPIEGSNPLPVVIRTSFTTAMTKRRIDSRYIRLY